MSDQAIRQQVLDVRQSFIVQAPAGSGKTSLLTLRFLSLLAVVEKVPEECLALTFTRMAAAEMRDRIISALKKAKEERSTGNLPQSIQGSYEDITRNLARRVLERDQKEAWNLLQNPHRLKIQTIDALCANICRSMPVTGGFGGTLEVTEDASKLYLKAAQNLLSTLETESDEEVASSLSILLSHLDNHLNLAARLLAEMLSHREQWLPHIGRSMSHENARGLLEASLKAVVSEALKTLVAKAPENFEEILTLLDYSDQQLKQLQLRADSKISNGSGIPNRTLISELEYLGLWQRITQLLLTETGTLRKTVTVAQGFPSPNLSAQKARNLGQSISPEEKAYLQSMRNRMLALLQNLESQTEFISALQDFKDCPPIAYSESGWQIIEALLNVLPQLVAELMMVFQEEGKVDFVQVSLSAKEALGASDAPSDLALSLDYKIRHLLIDEFQDTSIPQLRLLEQLVAGFEQNDGRSIFLVGDPMQSIYRFRQAEVGLFLKAKQFGLGGIPLISLKLKSNFRSDPKLVQWNNDFFSKLFPSEDNFTTGAISFHAMEAERPHDEYAEVLEYDVTTESEVVKIQELLDETRKKDKEGSIALLVRSRNQLKEILPKLREAGIEYQGIEIEYLNQRLGIRDLLTLSRALVHLGDRIAWLALLRGPFCGLSLKDLYFIANYEPRLPIWWTLERFQELHLSNESRISDSADSSSLISDSARKTLLHLVPILSNALRKRGRLPFMQWVLETWLELRNEQGSDLQDAESFFEFLEEGQQKYNFYAVGVLEDCFQKLYAKPKIVDPKALQVLTVHKSKGLEFDTVILAGLGRKLRSDSEKLLLWEERPSKTNDPYLLLAPIKSVSEQEDPIYNYLKKQGQKRAAFEEQRLLYVAKTRARKRLYCLRHDQIEAYQHES